jgi:ketosteroid isomerase-like protein
MQKEIVQQMYGEVTRDLAAIFADETALAAIAEAVGGALHPDFEFALASSDFTGLEGSYQGAEGWIGVMHTWLAAWETWSVTLDDVIEAGDQIVAVTRLHGISKTAGVEFDQQASDVWTFRDGLIFRLDSYLTLEEGLAAAGVD